MRIEDVRLEERGETMRARAMVHWEEAQRPSREIWFETTAEFRGEFRADPNAFLLACVIPAQRNGERRIAIDGPVCPQLSDGLVAAMALLTQWYGEPRRSLRIESRSGTAAPVPKSPPRSAFFLSGGVDSLHLLRSNRQQFPPGHPASFRDALFVFGRDHPDAEESDPARDHLARSLENLRPLAKTADFEIVPLGSNARRLESGNEFFLLEYFGSFLVAAALTLSRRWSTVSIASSWSLETLRPWGSHPLLDPCFATAATSVRHEGVLFTRMQKLLDLADWEGAIARLVVCNHGPWAPWLNCGRCSKCLLTLSALLIGGRLESATSFPPGSLTPEAILRLPTDGDFAGLWRQRTDGLRRAGHAKLVSAIERKIREGESFRRWSERRGWKGRFRQIDDRLLGGRLQKWRRGSFAG